VDIITLTYRDRTFTVRAIDLGPNWTTDACTASITELLPDGTTAEWDTDPPYSGHVLDRVGTIAAAVREVILTVDDDADPRNAITGEE
jgi:hypothetical protein